jgi:hypothetical protein
MEMAPGRRARTAESLVALTRPPQHRIARRRRAGRAMDPLLAEVARIVTAVRVTHDRGRRARAGRDGRDALYDGAPGIFGTA